MSILRKPYELSLWDEKLCLKLAMADGTEKDCYPEDYANVTGQISSIKYQFYKEQRLATIGSDTMTAPWRACNISYSPNINGSSTLEFTCYTNYFNEDDGIFEANPFTSFLVNERKVKLFYDGEWHDFIIKNIVESSDKNSFVYQCKDLFINELSKNGFSLEFDAKLENNMGSIDELADSILEESDWKRKDGDTIRQYKEEPLYVMTISKAVTARRMLDLSDEVGSETLNLAAGTKIFGFYQCVENKSNYFQFLYRADGNYPTNDDRVITNTPNYYIADAVDSNGNFIYFSNDYSISENYRGKRLVRSSQTKYDPITDRFVAVYKKGDQTIYGYQETEYTTSDFLRNYIVNSKDFPSTDGWRPASNLDLELFTIPPLPATNITEDTKFTTYLKWTANNYLINSCINENRSLIKAFAANEKYVIRVKENLYRDATGVTPIETTAQSSSNGLNFQVAEYKIVDSKFQISKVYFNFGKQSFTPADGYLQCVATCSESLTYEDLLDKKIGLLISGMDGKTYCLEELQFFKYVEDNGEMILPEQSLEAKTRIKYTYYEKPDDSVTDESQIKITYQGYDPDESLTSIYNEDCKKIRSITAKESNRFNLISTLCETFECWVRFEVEHDQNTGEILRDDDGRQKKWISFHEYAGADNFLGFKYGINLQSIQRELDSDSIASKLIVKNNSNEFADGGFCTISTSEENPIKENFILDFSYYINQGLLNFNQVNNDLYVDSPGQGYMGYYKKLRKLNEEVEENSRLQAELVSKTVPNLTSLKVNYETNSDNSNERLVSLRDQIQRTTGLTLEQLYADPTNSWWQDHDVYSLIVTCVRLKQNIAEYDRLLGIYSKDLEDSQNKLTMLQNRIEELTAAKRELNRIFYKKYSRYIQEGSWIDENYIDDTLYYLDGVSTLHTSSQPKATYTIKVVELSQLEGYELYNFKIGDKTFMEDVEFFGWADEKKSTPYKEEVVVTEIKFNLDDPTQNIVTVKNYKSNFEDLFQRINQITTNVQFSSGAYTKAASIVEPDGTINQLTLANSMANNTWVISNGNNNSVTWDENGIQTINMSSPNEIVRIVGGGIFLSKDFGTTWTTGLTASGINASSITTGTLNTDVLQIWNSNYPTFRWDTYGISAYKFTVNKTTGKLENYAPGQFVRFDQYGLYGILSNSVFQATSEDDVWDNAAFAVTWKGFQLRSHKTGQDQTGQGYIRITSNDDIQLIDGKGTERLKIGMLETSSSTGNTNYGMRITNVSGQVVLQTDDNGELFLSKIMRVGPKVLQAYSDRVKFGIVESYNAASEVSSSNIKFSKVLSVMGDSSIENNAQLAANEVLAIYDDGTLLANRLIAKNADIQGKIHADSGYFKGEIHADSGTIGNMKIESISNTIQSVRINAPQGSTFTQSGFDILPVSLPLEIELKGFEDAISTYKWYSSTDYITWTAISGQTKSTLSATPAMLQFGTNNISYIRCTVTIEKKNYEVYQALTLIPDSITYQIDSSLGYVINSTNSPTATTTLTARAFSNGNELDLSKKTVTWYDKTDKELDFSTAIGTGQSIQYNLSTFINSTRIYFTVS